MIFLSSSELVLSIQSYHWSWQEPGWAAISGYEDVLDSWRDSSLGGFQHWSCQHCGEQLLTPVSLQCAAGNVWGWIRPETNGGISTNWPTGGIWRSSGSESCSTPEEVRTLWYLSCTGPAWMLAAKQEQLMQFESWIGGSCTCNWFCQDFRGLITVVSYHGFVRFTSFFCILCSVLDSPHFVVGGSGPGEVFVGSCQDSSGTSVLRAFPHVSTQFVYINIHIQIFYFSEFQNRFRFHSHELSQLCFCKAFLEATPPLALQHRFCAHRYIHKMSNTFGKKVILQLISSMLQLCRPLRQLPVFRWWRWLFQKLSGCALSGAYLGWMIFWYLLFASLNR